MTQTQDFFAPLVGGGVRPETVCGVRLK